MTLTDRLNCSFNRGERLFIPHYYALSEAGNKKLDLLSYIQLFVEVVTLGVTLLAHTVISTFMYYR